MKQIGEATYRAYPRLRDDLRIGRRMRDAHGREALIVQDAVLHGLFSSGYRMPPQLGAVLATLDGTVGADELLARLNEVGGGAFTGAQVTSLLDRLEQLDLLESPRSSQRRADLADVYAALPERAPISGVMFYPHEPDALRDAVARCFALATPAHEAHAETPRAFMVPHAGLAASGICAAHALRYLPTGGLSVTYVIIGPNHVHPGPARAEITEQPYRTPLGLVPIDLRAMARLRQLAGDTIGVGPIAQHRDHSVENLLPLLQWHHERQNTNQRAPFAIIPLLLTGVRHRPGMREPDDHRARWDRLAAALRTLLDENGDAMRLLISGDFTHRGALFNFEPFDDDDTAFAHFDTPLLDAIGDGDASAALAAWTLGNSCIGRPAYVGLRAMPDARWHRHHYHIDRVGETGISFASFSEMTAGSGGEATRDTRL